jgi:hypothetical protein
MRKREREREREMRKRQRERCAINIKHKQREVPGKAWSGIGGVGTGMVWNARAGLAFASGGAVRVKIMRVRAE